MCPVPRPPALAAAVLLLLAPHPRLAAGEQTPRSFSGIYPHLAMFNAEDECGTGAVVPWAGRLWVVTYGPHCPYGSTDKLYEITPGLRQIVRPESVGGTSANRMVHRETGQLLIGPYVIDREGRVRVLAPAAMPGRLTGNARHLADPEGRAYYATMEEGLYDVDLRTLEVRTLIVDGNKPPAGLAVARPADAMRSTLPGCHGKGLSSGQGRIVYAQNGDEAAAALTDPTAPSGALAEWSSPGDWKLVRRNQFTEVTGPGGLFGNDHPESDPLWSLGWDHRSLLLALLDGGEWHLFRLPKASHCYDGAHGWNTEWPRIRDIGPAGSPDLLMTMHGMFWRFPRGFAAGKTAGIRPRSSYLKVVGDFCRWQERIVLGCDDTARSSFLNRRKAKGAMAGPGRSQSNLWFVDPATLDQLGPTDASGAVWSNDPVRAGQASDPFLVGGWEHRFVHLAHGADQPVTFSIESDPDGSGRWQPLARFTVPAGGSASYPLPSAPPAEWVRVVTDLSCPTASAFIHLRNPAPQRGAPEPGLFAGLARAGGGAVGGGHLQPSVGGQGTLLFAAREGSGEEARDQGLYELGPDFKLRPLADPGKLEWMRTRLAVPADGIQADPASLVIADDAGRRWRLPVAEPGLVKPGPLGLSRLCREVCTERDLLQAGGTFFEVPAENAGGFARLRPVASHGFAIDDFCSWRGLLVLSGTTPDAPATANGHLVRSEDGRCALWLGAVDDLWRMGKPTGRGGPWKDSPVKAGQASDPYLCYGYDQRSLALSHTGGGTVRFTIEIDPGNGCWQTWQQVEVAPGQTARPSIPPGFSARWIRFTTDQDTTATAWLDYQ